MYQQTQRRPIKMRSAQWSHQLASWLVGQGLSPNQVSVMSVVFAFAGAIFFVLSASALSSTSLCLIGAAFCVQLRLLCNMLDGLMAVENGKSSKQGDVFNEFPDRLADVVLFVGAGYAANSGELGVTLGWLCAALALGTAYIRAFGARYAPTQDYSGPLAKPQRMFVLTVGSLLCAIEAGLCGSTHLMLATLLIACLGTTLTCVNRTSRLLKVMEKL